MSNPHDEHAGGAPDPDGNRNLIEVLAVARMAALREGACASDADEVAQIVVERLWRKWGQPSVVSARQKGRTAWRRYVAKSARHALMDHRRSEGRRWRRERTASPLFRPRLPDRPGAGGRRALVAPSPADEIDEYLARRLIAQAMLTELTERQLEVAVLFFIDGWSTAEVAERLGVSARTIRSDRKEIVERIRAALLDDQGS